MCKAISNNLLEYPASLSYQIINLKNVSFNSIPAPASTMDVLGSPTKSCDTTLSLVNQEYPLIHYLRHTQMHS